MAKMYKIEIIHEAKLDIKNLENENVLKEVLDYLEKYKTEPFKHSKPLHNQGSLNLQGYRKTYVADATYRIVSKIEDGIAKIVEVVAVGSRENKEVYQNAHNRINN